MIKVHYTLGAEPFGDGKVKNKTYTTKDPEAFVEFLELGWVVVCDKSGQQLFAIHSHKINYVEGKNDSAA